MAQHWLFKSEPETYSFDQLLRDGRTNWDHVRNFQARNFLRQVKRGDPALIYHSGDDKAVVGIAECVKEAYPDIDPEGGDWVQIDLKPIRKLPGPVPLAALKGNPALKNLLLIRQSRLSCLPVTPEEFAIIVKMAQDGPSTAARFATKPVTKKKTASKTKKAKSVAKPKATKAKKK